MNMLYLISEQYLPLIIIAALVGFFGVVVIIIILVRRKFSALQIKKEEKNEEELIQEELDRILVPIEDEKINQEMAADAQKVLLDEQKKKAAQKVEVKTTKEDK